MAKKSSVIVALPKVVQSTIIQQDGETITSARLDAVVTGTPTGDIQFYLSANNGTNWEAATNNAIHTFTNTGTQLMWRAVGQYPVEITKITIKKNP